MLLIAHRGNINGPSDRENTPAQIDWCVQNSIDCEIDIWKSGDTLFLGHDLPQYQISLDWLAKRKDKLWIHCKNSLALTFFSTQRDIDWNFFWHQEDEYTITSKGYVWVYPGCEIVSESICVLPELWIDKYPSWDIGLCAGICTDFVTKYLPEFEFPNP